MPITSPRQRKYTEIRTKIHSPSFFFSSPVVSRRRFDVYRHDVAFSANLECRSEMCCTYAAGCKYNKQKIAKNSPSAHHRTILSGCIFATKPDIDNRKNIEQQYLLHMFSQYGELRPTNGWDRFVSLRHPSKFQQVSQLGVVTAATSLNGGQANFARCLAVSWAGTLYIDYRGILLPNGIVPCAKFTSVSYTHLTLPTNREV